MEMNKKLLFLVTEDWYFLSHRLPLALECKKKGYEVYIGCKDTGKMDVIKNYGFNCYNLKLYRGYSSISKIFMNISEIRKMIKITNVSIIHAVSVQSIVLTLLSTLFNKKVKVIAALTGLGSLFLAKSVKDKVIKFFIMIVLVLGLKKKYLKVIVQNKDDEKFVNKNLFCSKNKIAIIRGSGVNIDFHKFQSEPSYPPITISYVGRLIKDKGIEQLIEAFKLAFKSNKKIKLLLVGSFDSKNPRPISKNFLENTIKNDNSIEYIGEVKDVREIWRISHIAILLSRREGLPKSLLEAAAAGRAIISSDVPGSREIAVNSINAETVQLDDINGLTKAILYLAKNHKVRKSYGLKSRKLVESDMSEDQVIMKTLSLYKSFH